MKVSSGFFVRYPVDGIDKTGKYIDFYTPLSYSKECMTVQESAICHNLPSIRIFKPKNRKCHQPYHSPTSLGSIT